MTAGPGPSLAVVLVNYRRTDDTLACIASVQRSSFTHVRIYVVDNSPDESLGAAMHRTCPGIPVLHAGRNLGFAAGNNLGMRRALEDGCDAILLLNNDTEIDAGALEALMAALDGEPSAGIVGGKILYHASPERIWFAGGFFDFHAGSGGHTGIGETDHGQYDTRRECTFVTGCCLLIRRSVMERIGLLDESFFAYLEDVDYCARARAAGYRIIYEPLARVYHKVSATASWDSPLYLYFNCRNRILLLKKHATLMAVLPHLPQLLLYYARQMTRMAVKYRDRDGAQAVWMGIVDGLSGGTDELGAGRMDVLGPGRRRS